ncbi:hypothetical protein MTR67_006911 [Solanum verrucosum]|uniref:Uncharacterized protein n=1 Tax=Solanum verrucosum TaxID=315347 RepID=A0AAF0Q431_SOLVR|nr:hypothetical protein MTR67_006911 [Solanum verrucosum]
MSIDFLLPKRLSPSPPLRYRLMILCCVPYLEMVCHRQILSMVLGNGLAPVIIIMILH